jgi:hypothetical protein
MFFSTLQARLLVREVDGEDPRPCGRRLFLKGVAAGEPENTTKYERKK